MKKIAPGSKTNLASLASGGVRGIGFFVFKGRRVHVLVQSITPPCSLDLSPPRNDARADRTARAAADFQIGGSASAAGASRPPRKRGRLQPDLRRPDQKSEGRQVYCDRHSPVRDLGEALREEEGRAAPRGTRTGQDSSPSGEVASRTPRRQREDRDQFPRRFSHSQ